MPRDVADFGVTPQIIGDCTVLVVEGDLDLFAAVELDQALDAERARVIVDLSAVAFIDSAGIHALIQVRPTGRPAVVRPPGSNVARVLDIVNATHAVGIYDDVAAAVARLGGETATGLSAASDDSGVSPASHTRRQR